MSVRGVGRQTHKHDSWKRGEWFHANIEPIARNTQSDWQVRKTHKSTWIPPQYPGWKRFIDPWFSEIRELPYEEAIKNHWTKFPIKLVHIMIAHAEPHWNRLYNNLSVIFLHLGAGKFIAESRWIDQTIYLCPVIKRIRWK
jgi:hypothetical protein